MLLNSLLKNENLGGFYSWKIVEERSSSKKVHFTLEQAPFTLKA